MAEDQRIELINKLSNIRENLHIVCNMIKKEQWNTEQKIRLLNEAEQDINGALYELTGD